MFKSRRAVPVSDATCPAGGGETQKQTNIKHGNKRVSDKIQDQWQGFIFFFFCGSLWRTCVVTRAIREVKSHLSSRIHPWNGKLIQHNHRGWMLEAGLAVITSKTNTSPPPPTHFLLLLCVRRPSAATAGYSPQKTIYSKKNKTTTNNMQHYFCFNLLTSWLQPQVVEEFSFWSECNSDIWIDECGCAHLSFSFIFSLQCKQTSQHTNITQTKQSREGTHHPPLQRTTKERSVCKICTNDSITWSKYGR